jgi:hypothetical protein
LIALVLGLAGCSPQQRNETSSTESGTVAPLSTTTILATTPSSEHGPDTTTASTTNTTFGPGSIQYRNEKYGFTFLLPETWIGYARVSEKWEGIDLWLTPAEMKDSPLAVSPVGTPVTGPKILIRSPEWTEADPYQDIPIMVFTVSQWDRVQSGQLSVGAAPIPPTELGRNATYVFALPARYNYAFPTGWEEVESILQTNPLHGL